MTPRVYLAGPDVFDPDYASLFAARAEEGRRHGLEPRIPIDNAATTAPDIFRANVQLLEESHAVIANLSPFRGPHCDPGTAWEVGYAHARGLRVFAFSETGGNVIDRVGGTGGRDAAGLIVEDFGLPENLMLVMAADGHRLHPTFSAAVRAAAAHFAGEPA